MEKDINKLVEGYKNYTCSYIKVQKTPHGPGTTISKSDLEEPYNMYTYISFVGQLMWYTTKLGSDVVNAVRELAVHMIHPRPKHCNSFGCLILYLKGKET